MRVAVLKGGRSFERSVSLRSGARVEDALHATRAAVEEGITAGGGVTLLRARENVRGLTSVNPERLTPMS